MKMIDMTGERFGRLLVVARAENRGTVAAWRCLCDCGQEVIRTGGGLRLGQSLSCGCLRREKLVARNVANGRGEKAHPLHEVWRSMIRRCYDRRHISFADYGAKGIGVCDRWRDSFQTFLRDMGDRPEGTSIDRIDSAKWYEPGNCRWADHITQGNNRSNVKKFSLDGEFVSVAEACRRTGVQYQTAVGRMRRGWEAVAAVTTPARSLAR